MSTPQDPPRRRKQKARRAKQLAYWRANHPKSDESRVEQPLAQSPHRAAK